MSLRVLNPGLCTLVVDLGRPNARSLGVPVGGAADRTSLVIGNALVGNPPEAAALEFSLLGPTLEAQCELAGVVYGAPFEVQSDGQQLRCGTTFTLRAGQTLKIGSAPQGMRAYLCLAGGIQEKIILGSRSGLEPLRKGSELTCLPSCIGRHFARLDWRWQEEQQRLLSRIGLRDERLLARHSCLLRFLPGPQASWFPVDLGLEGTDNEALPPAFHVQAASNRMGLRLEGPPIPFPDRDMISEPVCPGSVQVTRNGQCIILGVDGQTIGGYPKIAQVIGADLDLVGQLRPGDTVFFQRVSLEEAERLYRAKAAEVHAWGLRLRTAASLCRWRLGGSGC